MCHASSNKCHASSNRCLTSSNKKLVGTSATLVVPRAFMFKRVQDSRPKSLLERVHSTSRPVR